MSSDFSDSPLPWEKKPPGGSPDDVDFDDIAEVEPPFVPSIEPESIPCWRCEKPVAVTMARCPFCRAKLREETPLERKVGQLRIPSDSPVLPFLLFFIGTLIISVIYFMILQSASSQGEGMESTYPFLIAFEIVDTVLVLIALGVCAGRLATIPERSAGEQATMWLLAGPILALSMGLNFGYFHVLREIVGLDDARLGVELTGLAVVLICVQPAIVEELLFRYLGIGALSQSMSYHGAIVVSSVMFGVAHLGNPLGIPYLILLGVILGYCRWYSGSILLPMLMHFVHNLIVLLVT